MTATGFRGTISWRSLRLLTAKWPSGIGSLLDALPETLLHSELLALARERGDADLERLAHEYLPLTFSRRHGDPSRPWNIFSIALKDEHGAKILNYEGNWRDIFQNWEALALSFPALSRA